MHILLAHEYYRKRGGEDAAYEARRDLLKARGIRVTEYVKRAEEIDNAGLARKATLPLRAIWAWDTKREFARVLRDTKPDVVHFSNTFPLISPSAYAACHEAGVPVVQHLENARLICPQGEFVRDGKVCYDCCGRFPWPGILHGCYHESSMQTAAVAGMIGVHRMLHTWSEKVDAYILTQEFYRPWFVDAGLPSERIHTCGLIVPDPGARNPNATGDYALYDGWLAPEKGILTLLEAWKTLDIPLKIRGFGPLEMDVRVAMATNPRIELVPRRTLEPKYDLFRNARFLIWPSVDEAETCGVVATEAFGCGVPVLAPKTAVASERVADGRTGIFFAPNDPADLARQVRWAWEHREQMAEMGRSARQEYEARLSSDQFLDRLIGIYEDLIDRKQPLRARAARLW
jgi:glycosyltransferase involved in cell wall biosynthesis